MSFGNTNFTCVRLPKNISIGFLSPYANISNSSGGECNLGNYTFPPAQHIPGVSLLHLRALFPITTLGKDCNHN